MELKNNILMSGCGGGYDIFTGLPIYFKFNKEYKIILANFSFTKKNLLEKFQKISESLYFVYYQSNIEIEKDLYFPEYYLSKELNVGIYCFVDCGLTNLIKDYEILVELHNIKSILLCDGGCDSIMKGNEEHLGTPVEDVMSMYAVHSLKSKNMIDRVYLSCLGVTVDTFIEIKYIDMMKNINRLINSNALIYQEFYNKNEDNIKKYINVFSNCQPKYSLINCCIVSALNGNFGNYHHEFLEERFKESTFNIDILTSCIFIFDFDIICKSNLYFNNLINYNDSDDIDEYIQNFNKKMKKYDL